MFNKTAHVLLKTLLSVGFVALTFLVVLPTIQVFAAPTVLQSTFGAKRVFNNATGNGKVYGVDAFMTTTDTPIPIGAQKTGAPVGITNWLAAPFAFAPFAESGPYKTCPGFCEYHPYSSYQDINGINNQMNRVDINLLPGGWYHYKTYFIGNDMWRTEFCDGNGCIILRDVNLKISVGVPYAIAGGEGISVDFGPVTSAAFKWRNKPGNWSNACYTHVLKTVNGQITPCGGNFDWTVRFP